MSTDPTPTPTPTQVDDLIQIQDLDTVHDRQVTASMGSHTIGRWSYPTRVFNGYTQYQTREGEWLDVPLESEDPQADQAAGDGTP